MFKEIRRGFQLQRPTDDFMAKLDLIDDYPRIFQDSSKKTQQNNNSLNLTLEELE